MDETKKCPNCGADVPENARFCKYCGHTFAEEGAADALKADESSPIPADQSSQTQRVENSSSKFFIPSLLLILLGFFIAAAEYSILENPFDTIMITGYGFQVTVMGAVALIATWIVDKRHIELGFSAYLFFLIALIVFVFGLTRIFSSFDYWDGFSLVSAAYGLTLLLFAACVAAIGALAFFVNKESL